MNPSEQAHLAIYAGTNAGMSGKNNEDRYAASAYKTRTRPAMPVVLAIIADGVGGHRAGEVASELAVETISHWVAESDGSQPVETLRQAITRANQDVFERSRSQLELNGMASTCACCLIIGDRLYTANLGDSRIYLARDDAIHQLSTDHTWIQEALDAGLITPEQALGHPNSHVIRRHLGAAEPPDIEFRLRFPNSLVDEAHPESSQGLVLLPGDQLLLCSDGLTDLVQADEIYAELKDHSGSEAVERLINLANERGGHDNITIVLLQAPDSILTAEPARTNHRRRWGMGCLVVGIGLAVLVAMSLFAGWYTGFWGTSSSPTTAPTPTALLMPTATLITPISNTFTATPIIKAASTLDPMRTPAEAGPTLTAWPTNTPSN